MPKVPSDPDTLDYIKRREAAIARTLTNDHVRDIKRVFTAYIAEAATRHDKEIIAVLKDASHKVVAVVRGSE